MTSTDKTEPPGSASSSLDELCKACGHARRRHYEEPSGECVACAPDSDAHWRHAFVPAEPEARCVGCEHTEAEGCGCPPPEPADEHCTCTSRESDGHGRIMHYSGCGMPEPEAPEEPGPRELAPCAICGDRRKTNEFKAGLLLCEPCIYSEGQPYCGACGSKEAPFGLVSHEGEDRFNELRCAKCLLPPRRPPYAVAYAVEGGAQYEIALPGDATVRAHEGALIITHASAVLALTQARPMED